MGMEEVEREDRLRAHGQGTEGIKETDPSMSLARVQRKSLPSIQVPFPRKLGDKSRMAAKNAISQRARSVGFDRRFGSKRIYGSAESGADFPYLHVMLLSSCPCILNLSRHAFLAHQLRIDARCQFVFLPSPSHSSSSFLLRLVSCQ